MDTIGPLSGIEVRESPIVPDGRIIVTLGDGDRLYVFAATVQDGGLAFHDPTDRATAMELLARGAALVVPVGAMVQLKRKSCDG